MFGFDAYVIFEREVDGPQSPGPWSQSDVQGEPLPHTKMGAVRLLQMIRDNKPRPQDFQFGVMLVGDSYPCDVTLSVLQEIEDEEAEQAKWAAEDAAHVRQESDPGVFL